MIDALRLAVGTLTIVPTGTVEVNPRTAGRAMALAPIAVLPLAVAVGLVAYATTRLGWPSLLTGLMVVATLALGTRALHLDGLADTADGLGSGWDRDRALAVMKRGDVGPFGVVTLVLVLGAQVVLVAELSHGPGALLVGLLVGVSRCAVPTACVRRLPAARASGLGADVAGTVSPAVVVGWWALATVAVALATPTSGWGGLLVVPVAALAASALVLRCVRRFGGITGDVIGAGVETAFTALLLLAVVTR